MARPIRDAELNSPIRGPEDFAAAVGASRETLDRLATYEQLLRQWQKTINLVAPSTLDAIWHRHFADSAQLLPLAPQAATWVDLGSGAGFPGLVLAILLANGVRPSARNLVLAADGAEGSDPTTPRVTLIESNARKCAFLREVARQTRVSARAAVDILSTSIVAAATPARMPR